MSPLRILVPLDGSRTAETALPIAVGLTRESGGSLYLLRVLPTPTPTAEASVQHRATVQNAERYLATTRQKIEAEGVLPISTAVWSGSAPAAIVKAADLITADMIIIATAGRTGPPRTLAGSVVDCVLRGTKRPVAVVTPEEAVVDTSLGEAAPESHLSAGLRTSGGRPPSAGEAYLETLHSVQQCEREVVRVVTTVQEAAKCLERWEAVHVAHAGAGFPKEVTMAGRVIDAASWPTARQLADTLADWHSSAEAARVAWGRVPPEERSTLPPPP
jgi:nucleotide-binding universal stress UspA family protein